MARGTRGAVEAIVDPVGYMVVLPVVKLRGLGEGEWVKAVEEKRGKERERRRERAGVKVGDKLRVALQC